MSLFNEMDEENKIKSIVVNAVLNGLSSDNSYHFWNEAMEWAKSKNYFPNLSEDDFLKIAKKYDIWNDFEIACQKVGDLSK